MRHIMKYMAATLLMGSAALTAAAETVSQKEASRIASLFFNESYGQVMQKPKLVWNGRRLTTSHLFTPFYVYNHPAGGFVVVSAENKAFPILAYSIKESFNPDKLNENLRSLLGRYAHDIEMIRYDSRIPEEAIAAWNDIPGTISGILKAPAQYSEVVLTGPELKESFENIIYGSQDEAFSDIYSPSQWNMLIDDQFLANRNVKIAVVDNGNYYPLQITGKKGDYYRFMSGNDSMLARINATEYLTPLMMAELSSYPLLAVPEEQDDDFSFYDEILSWQESERERIAGMKERELELLKPIVVSNGGGHFQITMPDEIRMARVFNVGGAMLQEKYFRNTNVATINLEAEPGGFYIVLLLSENGSTSSFKLFR